jgi:hypothetical protein
MQRNRPAAICFSRKRREHPTRWGSLSKPKGRAFDGGLMCCVDHTQAQLRSKTNDKNGGKLRLHPLYFLDLPGLPFIPCLIPYSLRISLTRP